MKKKKLGRIFRYVGIAILLCIAIFMSIIACRKETKGLSYDNYGYKMVIYYDQQLTSFNNDYYVFATGLPVVAYTWDNVQGWQKFIGSQAVWDDYYWYIQKVLDVSDGLGIGFSSFTRKGVYLISYVQTSTDIAIYKVTTIGIYNSYGGIQIYDNGLQAGLDSSNQESYNQGFNQGYIQGQDSLSGDLQSQAEYYQGVIDSLNSDISHYQQIINSGTTPWGSFQSLLGSIFLFPIKFFKEGFDVNLFGVNIGGLIVGIGMLGITFAIVGLILGRRGGK